MSISNGFAIWIVVLAALLVIPQSTIESAIRNPQSTNQSAIRQSAIDNQSAVRNPQSAIAGAPWRALLDGSSLDAWRGYKTETIPAGWRIDQGALVKDKPVADIVSKDEFGDFELELEWKIGEAGNSGIFYRGTEEYDHIYWSAPGVSAARRHQGRRQQDAADVRRCGLRALSRHPPAT